MKKLLCIALFSIAIMANATEKKENVANNFNEVKTENFDFEKVTSVDGKLAILGCTKDGNAYYSMLRSEGMDHREARTARRAFVRECRNYFWQFEG